jgi:hypothetical protein
MMGSIIFSPKKIGEKVVILGSNYSLLSIKKISEKAI